MMAHDALGAHRRDELGLADDGGSRPVQAAVFSAAAFTSGAILPVVIAALAPRHLAVMVVPVVAIVLLAILGAIGAKAGGAPQVRAVVRVTALGALAMAATALLGHLLPVGAL